MTLTEISHNSLERLRLFGDAAPLMRNIESDSLSYLDSGFKKSYFNIIHLKNTENIETVKEAIAFNENRLRNFELRINENIQSPDFSKFIEQENLHKLDRLYSYAIQTENILPIAAHSYDISLVSDKQGVIDFAYVLASLSEPMDVDVIHFYHNMHQELLKHQNLVLLSVYHNGAITGCAELFIDSQNNAVIHHLAVIGEEQGKGIAKALINAILELLQEKNISKIGIQSTENAKSFFENLSLAFIGITNCYTSKKEK